MEATLTALYYPHMSFGNERFLKNALLLWDQVELISPNGFLGQQDTAEANSAFELIARSLVPSEKQKKDTHDAIMELVESDLPYWFFPSRVSERLHYSIYTRKFLPETWEALQRYKLATHINFDEPISNPERRKLGYKKLQQGYVTSKGFGITMMSILADCCAGNTKQLVTDEIDSYIRLERYLSLIGGADSEEQRNNSDHDRLVTLSLTAIDLSNVDMSALVRMRKKESKDAGIRAMRHAYVKQLGSYAERLAKEAHNIGDVEEIERVFQQEVADDLDLLKDQLKDEAKKVIFSKEFAAAALAVAGTVILPIPGLLGAAWSLGRAHLQYKADRNKALASHSMSWLYEFQRFKPF